MEDLTENSKLKKYIMVLFGVAICGILDLSDIVREYLQLVPFPNQSFQFTVIAVLILDFAACYVIEKTIKKLYLKTFD